MNLKRVLFTIALVMVVCSVSYGQKSKLNRANKYFKDLAYQNAMELYLDILDKRDVSEAKINLAECYRKVGNTVEAEYWYGQVVRLSESEPIHKLYYGMALQSNGKCELAKEWFAEYTKLAPDDLRGQYLAEACDAQNDLENKNRGMYEVTHLPFNTAFDDFGPAFYKNGLVYASERDKGWAVNREHTWTGNPFLELFYVESNLEDEETKEYTYSGAVKFSSELNTKFHDAALVFSEDGSTVFFTRNNLIDGKVGKDDENVIRLKIYYAANSGEGWGDMRGVPFNSDEYSVAHPAITPDGSTLYFASDMPGGFGGMDLYKSTNQEGRWSPPTNLGPAVNTEGHEVFPYYHKDGRLYFASDGHIGLGGLDINYMDDNDGTWGPVVNLGYPINTQSDDFGLIIDSKGDFGYFSSDREGGTGMDDIYSFKKNAIEVDILVYDEATREPIDGASVHNDCNNSTLVTGPDGKVTMALPYNKCCTFEADREPYKSNSKKGCTQDVPVGERLLVEIPLSQPMEFQLLGTVLNKNTGQPVEGATVILTNDCGDEDVTIVTDASGTYDFELKKECCYSLKGEKETFQPDFVNNICTRGLTQSETFNQNLNLGKFIEPPVTKVDQPTSPQPQPYNPSQPSQPSGVSNPQVIDPSLPSVSWVDSRTNEVQTGQRFLLHIYYDFDQAFIRDDAQPELNKLLGIMNDNPGIVVEIGSHTDARGSHRYNRNLSARRAESVVRWLVNNGIPKSRLRSKGYGETQPINGCRNSIPCSEEQHQRNRRTEFTIVATTNGDSYSSQMPETVRVDPCEGCPF